GSTSAGGASSAGTTRVVSLSNEPPAWPSRYFRSEPGEINRASVPASAAAVRALSRRARSVAGAGAGVCSERLDMPRAYFAPDFRLVPGEVWQARIHERSPRPAGRGRVVLPGLLRVAGIVASTRRHAGQRGARVHRHGCPHHHRPAPVTVGGVSRRRLATTVPGGSDPQLQGA